MTTNMTNISELATKFNNDVSAIKLELKKVQSTKCRLAKKKGMKNYTEEMTKVVQYEQTLKEARRLLDQKERPVTEYTQDDVDNLDYDETIKAIRSIQSKKSLTKWLTDVECDNDEYREACRIETMLTAHREKIKPVDDSNIRKTELSNLIEIIESTNDLTKEEIIAMFKKLL